MYYLFSETNENSQFFNYTNENQVILRIKQYVPSRKSTVSFVFRINNSGSRSPGPEIRARSRGYGEIISRRCRILGANRTDRFGTRRKTPKNRYGPELVHVVRRVDAKPDMYSYNLRSKW